MKKINQIEKQDDKIIEMKKQDSLDELNGLYSWDEKTDAIKLKKEAGEQ